jgi:hypothetical protein
MDEAIMTRYIATSFAGVETTTNLGYTFFFYGAERMLPFATIASSDNAYEQISQLDRPGVYRLNIGVSPQTFQALFGTNRVDVSTYDFTALDTIMPHPDYAAQSWVCVLNPSEDTFEHQVRPFLAEAYVRAIARAQRREAQ